MKASCLRGVIVVVSLAASWASAQNLPCTRTDESNMTVSGCLYCVANQATDQDYGTDADSVLATSDRVAGAADGGATATGDFLVTMECNTDWDQVTYAPSVCSVTERTATASGTQAGDYAESETLDSASGTATFRVGANGSVTTGTLYGSMHLVSDGSGPIIDGSMAARCAGSYVYALIGETVWDWDGWTIFGVRQTLQGPEEISEYIPSLDIDVLYETEESTEEGNYHDLTSGSGIWGKPVIIDQNSSSLDWDLEASAWFEIQGD